MDDERDCYDARPPVQGTSELARMATGLVCLAIMLAISATGFVMFGAMARLVWWCVALGWSVLP